MNPGISGRTRVFGLVGHPVRHSLSPEMHTALFRQLGLDAVYLAFDVDPRRSDQVADSIRTLDLVGVNLTVPFKERVLPFLDHCTIAAQEAGAVNCVINVDGHLTGYNTDGAGLLGALDEEHQFQPANRRCAVLGAGGAGRAVAASLVAGGAQVTLFNRTLARAAAACERIAARPRSLAPESFDEPFELIVNCLGGGAEDLVESLPLGSLPAHAIWCDVNYWMPDPPRVRACRAAGLRVSEGLGMLLHQGALSFELFTGHPVSPSDLRAALSVK